MTPENPILTSRKSGLVIAAIGIQLLLCSIATAANTCSESIDRSARRLPAQVAQALREIVDRSTHAGNPAALESSPGFRLSDTPLASKAPTESAIVSPIDAWSRRTLNLPPPAIS